MSVPTMSEPQGVVYYPRALVSGVANLQFTTNRSGIAQVPLFLNLDKSLIGTHFYLQAALPDPGTATPTKVTVTNGLDVTLGGDR